MMINTTAIVSMTEANQGVLSFSHLLDAPADTPAWKA